MGEVRAWGYMNGRSLKKWIRSVALSVPPTPAKAAENMKVGFTGRAGEGPGKNRGDEDEADDEGYQAPWRSTSMIIG